MPSRTLLALVALVGASRLTAADVDFNRDVRPILSDVCFACHGPDARVRKADLRLDTEAGLKQVRDGQAVAALIVARVTAKAADEVMPPPKHLKQLTPKQVATLKQWVEQGAKVEGHWAFQPIKRPTPPVAGHPVDAFIRAELAKQGLAPSPPGDRVTLLRRLSFDLVGLPPTPEEVDAFVKDATPDAYAKAVDRLLASPHYGERMAMVWLDLVRYADSVGYHGDQAVSVSPYRDWVIRAFNANVAFDRFTKEQLAGDLLPNPTQDQLVAAGYNRLGMMSAEGGGQPKEYLAKYAAERVRNLSGAWLGVTIGCA
jgi:mono/diheme cytochrome c family protein